MLKYTKITPLTSVSQKKFHENQIENDFLIIFFEKKKYNMYIVEKVNAPIPLVNYCIQILTLNSIPFWQMCFQNMILILCI